MPFKDKQKNRIYQREWSKKHRDNRYNYHLQMRKKAYEKLGGKCVYCGCDIQEALEFNHINGGGCKELKVEKISGKQLVLDIVFDRRKDIELSCRACNAVHYLEKIKGLGNHWKVVYTP